MYYTANPNKSDRIATEGYKNWFTTQIWKADSEFNDDGERVVEYTKNRLPPQLQRVKDLGYYIPPAPKQKMSFYQMCIRKIGEYYNDLITPKGSNNSIVLQAVGNKTWVLKAFNRMSLFSLVYFYAIDIKLLIENNALGLRDELSRICIARRPTDDVVMTYFNKLKTKLNKKGDFDRWLDSTFTSGETETTWRKAIFQTLQGLNTTFNPLMEILQYSFIPHVAAIEGIPTDDFYSNMKEADKAGCAAITQQVSEAMANSLQHIKNGLIFQAIEGLKALSNNQQPVSISVSNLATNSA